MPPLGHQPALHTPMSKHLLPAAQHDLGHLSHAFVLFDLRNPLVVPVSALQKQDLLSAGCLVPCSAPCNLTLGLSIHLSLVFKLLLPVASSFIFTRFEASVLICQNKMPSPSCLRSKSAIFLKAMVFQATGNAVDIWYSEGLGSSTRSGL